MKNFVLRELLNKQFRLKNQISVSGEKKLYSSRQDQTISEDQRWKTKDEDRSPKNEIKQKALLREREGNGKESRQDKTLCESCGAFLAGNERTQLNTQIRRKLRRK